MNAVRKRLWILPVLGALVAQTGCRMAPNDTVPRAPVSASAGYAPHGWMTLDDPDLVRLFERAQAQHLSSRVAVSRVRASRACLMAPDGLSKRTGATAGFWQQGFDATWEMPLFALQESPGILGDRVDERNDAMVSLLAEMARDYLELCGLRHRSVLTIGNLVIQADVLELTGSLARQGLATDMELARAQDQVKLARAQVAPIQVGIARIEHAIAILLDQDPDVLAAELDRDGPAPAVPSFMGDLSSDLLRRRPDVRRAEGWVAGINPRIAAALAHDYPKFTLTGNFPYDSARFSAALADTSRSLTGHPGAVRDLSDFSQTAALAPHEMGNRQQALLAYQYTFLSALRDVEDALAAFREGQEHESHLVRAVDGASQALEVSRCKYLMGTVDYMEVLGAERRLLVSQDALAQSRQAVALHLVALYKALGGGWETRSKEGLPGPTS